MEENRYAQAVIEALDDACEEGQGAVSEETKDRIAAIIPGEEEFREALPAIKASKEAYDNNVANADKNKKAWDDSKKLWKQRSDVLMDIVGRCAERLNMHGRVTEGDTTLNLSSRRFLNVSDPDWLIGQYQKQIDDAAALLPEFLKMEVSIDKKKLEAYLSKDVSLMVNHPDKIRYDVSHSVSFKK